jgi:hypothetical protein
MSKDLIIGSFTNYDWNKIKYWVNSIAASGFTGDKAMLIYNCEIQTAQALSERGFKIMAFNQDRNTGHLFFDGQLIIVVERFFHLWQFMDQLIKDNDYRYVIHTDVKDVVFQTNPSEWLTANMGDAKILASSESLQYQHEPWGNDNMARSFPWVYPTVKDKPIWNCGVQAGVPSVMKDLWINIYLLCKGNTVPNPDQAAYNVLLNLEPYKSITKFASSEDGWACQAGTTIDPAKIAGFKQHLLEPQPVWDGNYATTSTGIRHAVLHQYDRIPNWKPIVEARYS